MNHFRSLARVKMALAPQPPIQQSCPSRKVSVPAASAFLCVPGRGWGMFASIAKYFAKFSLDILYSTDIS